VAFPPTRQSVVEKVRSGDPRERALALESLAAAYWRPVVRYLRRRGRARDDEAEDLAQGFFASALEKGWLERFQPARGRFRSYLLACLEAYLANRRRADRRLKRGGGAESVPLDGTGPDGEPRELELAAATDLEAEFQREWARGLFALAVGTLRRRCAGTPRELAFRLFERYDLADHEPSQRPRYQDLAAEFGVPVTQVTNHLHWARRELRETVLQTLRETTASEQEFRAEALALFGIEPA
jgi:RNA polymerase sigma factor (sigma-70 family)